jgi:hypothetical protein
VASHPSSVGPGPSHRPNPSPKGVILSAKREESRCHKGTQQSGSEISFGFAQDKFLHLLRMTCRVVAHVLQVPCEARQRLTRNSSERIWKLGECSRKEADLAPAE